MSALLGVVALLADAAAYQQPNEWNYVIAGWSLVALGIVAYIVVTLRRGRQLARQLPPEDRRWMS